MVYKCVYLYQYKTKNIFATACSVPLASLSEEKGTGEKNIKYEKHPSKSQNHLTD